MCKKRKLNVSINDYTYPSPNKAIQQNKPIVTNNHDMSNNIANVSNHNINIKTTNTKTKNKLVVTALITIMEPATESQSSRAYKQPLRSHPSWTLGPMEIFISYKKEKTNPFPTWLGRRQSLGAHQMGVSKLTEEASSDSIFWVFCKQRVHDTTWYCKVWLNHMNEPGFDLILGCNTMTELGIVLDFRTKEITLDDISLPMRGIKKLQTR